MCSERTKSRVNIKLSFRGINVRGGQVCACRACEGGNSAQGRIIERSARGKHHRRVPRRRAEGKGDAEEANDAVRSPRLIRTCRDVGRHGGRPWHRRRVQEVRAEHIQQEQVQQLLQAEGGAQRGGSGMQQGEFCLMDYLSLSLSLSSSRWCVCSSCACLSFLLSPSLSAFSPRLRLSRPRLASSSSAQTRFYRRLDRSRACVHGPCVSRSGIFSFLLALSNSLPRPSVIGTERRRTKVLSVRDDVM